MICVSFLAASSVALDSVAPQNFTQLINHSSNDSATFQQQFQLDVSNFKPGGPILFLQGAESATPMTNSTVYSNVISEYAVELQAIVVAIEHRYFGYSFPPDFDGSTKSYSALTLDNVLMDSVALINHIKKSVPGAQDSKVVATGGMRILHFAHIS